MAGALIAALGLAGAAAAAGSIVFSRGPGTGKPPARLRGLSLHRVGRDHRRLATSVSGVSGPTGRIGFSHTLVHERVGNKKKAGYWKTWSNRYHGDVYYSSSVVTITLPAGTKAFYFYAEPNTQSKFNIAAASGGTSSGAIAVRGKRGAKFFGFAAKGGGHLSSVSVASSDSSGFAIGEFGIH